MTLSLRPYQQEAISGLYDWFSKNTGNPLISSATGTGKSLLVAKLCEDAMRWPNQHVLMLTHVKELVDQNYKKLIDLWPLARAGIYCAGLGRKEKDHPITFASIQSIYKRKDIYASICIIDEAHLLGDTEDGMYRRFIKALREINPNMPIVGLSATCWRTKTGLLHIGDKAMFDAVVYDYPLKRAIEDGYLVPFTDKSSKTQGSTDSIGLTGGEFKMVEAGEEFDTEEMTSAILDETFQLASDRKTWLFFCTTIDHAEHMRNALRARGITAETISERTSKLDRERIINGLKDFSIRAVTNVSVLTTGTDIPNIDFIGMVRPTMSPGLILQMTGRGSRPYDVDLSKYETASERRLAISQSQKPDCLILDWAGNLLRHGPLTHIEAPAGGLRQGKKDKKGKVCPVCDTICQIVSKECHDCGHLFQGAPRVIKHALQASNARAMSDDPIVGETPVWLNVQSTDYKVHKKLGSPDSVMVTYNCVSSRVSEWQCPEHSGFPKQKFQSWWTSRGGSHPFPINAEETISRINEVENIKDLRVKVVKDGRYSKILRAEWERV